MLLHSGTCSAEAKSVACKLKSRIFSDGNQSTQAKAFFNLSDYQIRDSNTRVGGQCKSVSPLH